MRMRGKPCYNGLVYLTKVVREAGHFVAQHPGVDKQHAGLTLHDNGIALAELALVDQHTLGDQPQHGCKATAGPYDPPSPARPDRMSRPRGLDEP